MKRQLLIHAGAHRTATSSIQAFLRGNFDALLAAGYHNPYGAGRNVKLANAIFQKDADIAAIADDLNRKADARQVPIHTILISDEDICMRRDLSALAELRKTFDVKVLYSMRRQDLWLESWHQQNVKWQWNPALAHLTLPEFLARRKEFHWIDYDRLTNHLSDIVGAENLVLRIFEKSEMPDGPVAAFCTDIGLTAGQGFVHVPALNSSLDPVLSEFMRLLPLDEMKESYRTIVESAVTELDLQHKGAKARSSSLLMDHATRMAILSEYSDGNARVAARFFNRDKLFRDSIPTADMPLANQTLPADSYALMREFVAPVMRSIMLNVERRMTESADAKKGKARLAS